MNKNEYVLALKNQIAHCERMIDGLKEKPDREPFTTILKNKEEALISYNTALAKAEGFDYMSEI